MPRRFESASSLRVGFVAPAKPPLQANGRQSSSMVEMVAFANVTDTKAVIQAKTAAKTMKTTK
jgi:hypothetical protein